MPKGAKGEKRPADAIGTAIKRKRKAPPERAAGAALVPRRSMRPSTSEPAAGEITTGGRLYRWVASAGVAQRLLRATGSQEGPGVIFFALQTSDVIFGVLLKRLHTKWTAAKVENGPITLQFLGQRW